jgi:hypothetical protein
MSAIKMFNAVMLLRVQIDRSVGVVRALYF